MKNESRYQIEADWVINYDCNYSCDYCINGSSVKNPVIDNDRIKKYVNFFDLTERTWLFHFTGGEPLLYSGFTKLCADLSKQHLIALNSNISLENIYEIAKIIPPNRFEYIHCALHPKERAKHEGLLKLTQKLTFFMDRGFFIFLSCVMTPDIFPYFEHYQEMFSKNGFALIPKSLRGTYNSLPYPESYTDNQKEALTRYYKNLEFISNDFLARSPTINPLLDQYFLNGFPDFNGVLCSAGKDFVRIKPDGKIFRCGKLHKIGDITEGQLNLYTDNHICNDTCCPYFCLRYSKLTIDEAIRLPKRWKT